MNSVRKMSKRKNYLHLFFLLLPLLVSANTDTISIDHKLQRLGIAGYASILETKDLYTIEQVVLLENLFNPYESKGELLRLGRERNTHFWVKLSVKNISDTSQNLILRVGDTYFRQMAFYIPQRNTSAFAGLSDSFYSRTTPHRNSVLKFAAEANEPVDIYIWIDGKWDPVNFSLNLYSEHFFLKQSLKEYFLFGGFHGVLLILSVLSVILFAATRLRLFLLYSFYTLAVGFLSFSIMGFDYQLFYPNSPNVAHHAKLLLVVVSFAAFYGLAKEYFKPSHQLIFRRKISVIIYSVCAIILLFVAFQDSIDKVDIEFRAFNFLPMAFFSLVALMILIAVVRIVRQHPKWDNIIFLLGYSVTLIYIVFFVFINNGIIKLFFNTEYMFQWAVLWEITCLSVLMGLKANHIRKEKQELNLEIATVRIEKKQLSLLNKAKTKFYTDITHEFRTPLTVIQGLSSQIQGNDKEKVLIQRNSSILLRLINQILTLSKADKGEIKPKYIQGNIIAFIRYLSESFESWATQKRIRIHLLAETPECFMDYSEEILQKVLGNLLSNAIKFTPEGGDIYIIIKNIKKQLSISIQDTGEGISSENLKRIFDRFYQIDSPDSNQKQGTGIGLALCKELVKLMNGEIEVKSQLGAGSTFSVNLPIQQRSLLKDNNAFSKIEGVEEVDQNDIDFEFVEQNLIKSAPTILVIEDNKDVLHYITSCLSNKYHLLTAPNGRIGLEIAIAEIPDLILTDIMMPEMNGLEVCEALRSNITTSHIPIVFLTAKADQSSKLIGLKRGADAYLVKPFDKEELLVHVSSIIAQRKRIQQFFLTGAPQIQSKEYEVDNQFLKSVKDTTFKWLDDTSYDVQRLAREIGMSRSQIYRKVKALTGRSIASYIRYIRLQEGKKLLETTQKTISEIAYETGFKDLSYFSTSFLQEFGCTPSETRK